MGLSSEGSNTNTKIIKLRPKIVDCVSLDFAKDSTAYMFLIIKSDHLDMHVNTILESIDAEFFESIFSYN